MLFTKRALAMAFAATRTALLPIARRLVASRRQLWGRPPLGPLPDIFRDLEHHMRSMEREMGRTFRDLERFAGGWNPAFRWLRSRDVPVESGLEGDKFKLQLDVADFKPEEVRVSLIGNQVTVRARAERKNDDGTAVVREFSHSTTLPDDVDPDTVRSVLNPDGSLCIEGPRKQIAAPQEPREMPIERAGKQ